MTTTYKPLTPREAVANWLRTPNRVEYRCFRHSEYWRKLDGQCVLDILTSPGFDFRLVIEPKPETVESVISNSLCDKEFFRALVAALKHEIKSELREEMKR